MPDLEQLLAAAGDAETAARDAAAALTAQREALSSLAKERGEFLRRADLRTTRAEEQLTDLDAQIEAARAAVEERREVAKTARADALAAWAAAKELADPRTRIAELDDSVPLLLMPLRIETRFKGGELWLRVFPDDWAVDTFEERLSEVEVESAVRYWRAYWRAAGAEDRRRAAWRGLVASHGSGRAAWIVANYRPVVEADEPVRTSDADVVLVVVSDAPATDRDPATTFWKAVWRAGEDGDAIEQARDALVAATSPARAEAVLALPPYNLDDPVPPGADRATVPVKVGFLQVPVAASTRESSWTQAARARVLPDRMVVLGYTGDEQVLIEMGNPIPPTLAVGPDPYAGPADQLRIEDGKLIVPDELLWMTDFDRAIEVGMGLRIELDERTRRGFDRLVVVGLRATASPEDSQSELETLIRHHASSRSGFALVAQGAPTNNTEDVSAGLERLDDPDASYDRLFGAAPELEDRPDWRTKQDGQWLAEALGIDPAVLADVAGAAGTDQAEARAMNEALWPATWGYFLETMLHPVLGDETIDEVREFFESYVSGRGLVPAIRVGRQPYGVLPTTAFSRLTFLRDDQRPVTTHVAGFDQTVPFLARLDAVLRRVAADWDPLTADVPHVGGPAPDPHQALLDIVALHPASVEFHQRYAESIEDLFNRLNFFGFGGNLLAAILALGLAQGGRDLLESFGYAGEDPDILSKIFLGGQQQLAPRLVDDVPASETDVVRDYTADGRNYLEWLADTSLTSLEELRAQAGFAAGPPAVLLYLLLRHSLMLSWWDTSLRLRADAGVLSAAGLRSARREAPFVHVAEAQESESRWDSLYRAQPEVTGDAGVQIADFIPSIVATPVAWRLNRVGRAIERLEQVPTARLERALVEHLDCCSYRLDAWRLGLVHHRLLSMRLGANPGAAPVRRGIHLGAYGWLEDVRPGPPLVPAKVSDRVSRTFVTSGDPPLLKDPAGGGYVHAPSLNHATTAAVLRSGYLANATPAAPETMSVNLSSERVRLALGVLEGIRNGQSFGALLGYRFERGLHDRHSLAEVDKFVYPLRKAFPLPGDRDGRQVVDGLALVARVQTPGRRPYPFGRDDLPPASSSEAAVIDSEVDRLLDVHDAVADLALAEGVHQAVLGNYDRVGSTLDAYSKTGFPPEPAVVETPRSGIGLTLRMGVHFRPGLDHATSPVAGVPMTPRAMAEPAVNEFLADLLPLPADVGVRVVWTQPHGAAGGETVVTQEDLDLQPADLLAWLRLNDRAALSALDERILRRVETQANLRPDATVEIRYTDALPAPRRTFFEIAPLVDHVRAVIQRSRPLRPSDVLLHNEAVREADATLTVRETRPAAVRSALGTLSAALATFVTDVETLLADTVANRAALIAGVDTFCARAKDLLARAALFGLAGSGWAEVSERQRTLMTAVLDETAAVVARWDQRLADADAHLAHDASLPSTATPGERIEVLVLADRALRPAPTMPIPTDPDAYRTAIEAHRTQFVAKRGSLAGIAAAVTSLSGAVAAARATEPLTAFDDAGLALTPIEDSILEFCRFLADRVTAVRLDAEARRAAAQEHLSAAGSAGAADARVELVTAATRALLGDDAVVVPEFTLSAEHGAEWAAADNWARNGGLTAHLASRAFPVDDWMHGVARVREKVRRWEHVMMLGGTVGRLEPALRPIQLPHANEPWLALELPDGHRIAGDRLLYTAHYPASFDKDAPHCGLLVDDWTEVIPGTSETTGVTFHYDRPDAEPPQAMLLVTPPEVRGRWRWDDLVAALHETLDFAKTRAVEPVAIDGTAYAAFLPATVMAATLSGISIALNLSLVNQLFDFVDGDGA